MGAKELIRSHRLRRVAFELSPGLASGAAPGYVKAVNFLAAAGYRCSSCGSPRARRAPPSSSSSPTSPQAQRCSAAPTSVRGPTSSASRRASIQPRECVCEVKCESVAREGGMDDGQGRSGNDGVQK